jgi:hypothetical protein
MLSSIHLSPINTEFETMLRSRYLRKPSWMVSRTVDTAALHTIERDTGKRSHVKPAWTDYVRPECTAPAWEAPAGGDANVGNMPVWDESVIFHEDLSLFVQPGVLLLFEIIEWGPSLPETSRTSCHKYVM